MADDLANAKGVPSRADKRAYDNEEDCFFCRFWRDIPRTPGWRDGADDPTLSGECRRRSPIGKGWPTAMEHDWCGEFEPSSDGK